MKGGYKVEWYAQALGTNRFDRSSQNNASDDWSGICGLSASDALQTSYRDQSSMVAMEQPWDHSVDRAPGWRHRQAFPQTC